MFFAAYAQKDWFKRLTSASLRAPGTPRSAYGKLEFWLQKTPFGRMGRFNFAFIVCVSSVNGGMAPGEMETIFATEYGIRMCSPFSAGIARRTAIQPKIFFSQPNGEDQSPRSEMSAANGILLNIRFAYDIAVPARVWMFEPLGSKSSA